jgi:hypothetical protein
MKIKLNGIDFDDGSFFYWFDRISNAKNRLLGYQRIGPVHMLCFWWFCMMWGM